MAKNFRNLLSILTLCVSLPAVAQQIDHSRPEYANLQPAAPLASEKGFAWTYDKWTPPPALENPCSKEAHNWYSAVADDGFRYPTWHPPTDPSGCHFGHSHNMNPRLSPLYERFGEVYFGYAAQQMLLNQQQHIHRGESHEGYKITHGHRVYTPPRLSLAPDLEADLMSVIHMGTFSADAFTNNQHEQHFRYYLVDAEGNEWSGNAKLMTIAGRPGGFTPTCGPTTAFVAVGPPVPPDSPTTNPLAIGGSVGIKRIPTSNCIIKAKPNDGQDLLEVWQTGNGIRGPADFVSSTGRITTDAIVLQPHWYWFATTMSRYFDFRTMGMNKTLNSCYEKNLLGAYIVQNSKCINARREMPDGPFTGVVCHPANPFTGNTITIRFTTLMHNNPTGPEVFYTTVHGQRPSETYFPGAIQQFVSRGSLPAKNFTYTSTKETISFKETDPFLCDQN